MLLRDILLKQLFSTPADSEFDIRNTSFFKILQANPSLARFYPDFFRGPGANSSIIKDLEARSGIFFNPDRFPETHQPTGQTKDSGSMAINQKIRVCTHIKVNGIRCGSPALREEVFCYFHQRMIRGVRTPPKSRLHPMSLLEDPESIQASLMETINALVRNQIDVERARLVLRALHIAVKNAAKVRFGLWPQEMVNEVPQYPAAPPAAGPFSVVAAQAEALNRINSPQDRNEELEVERITHALRTPSADTSARRPPASKKRLRPALPAIPKRDGLSRPQPYQ